MIDSKDNAIKEDDRSIFFDAIYVCMTFLKMVCMWMDSSVIVMNSVEYNVEDKNWDFLRRALPDEL